MVLAFIIFGFVGGVASAVYYSPYEESELQESQQPIIVETQMLDIPQPLQIEILGQEPVLIPEYSSELQEIVIAESPSRVNIEPFEIYSDLPEKESAEPSGLELVIETLFGRYNPDMITVTRQVPHTLRVSTQYGVYEYQTIMITVQETQPSINKTWLAGVLLFSIILYSFFRAIGGLVKRS